MPYRPTAPWLQTVDIEVFRADWLSGLSCSELARKYRATRNAIVGAVARARSVEGEQRWPHREQPGGRSPKPRRVDLLSTHAPRRRAEAVKSPRPRTPTHPYHTQRRAALTIVGFLLRASNSRASSVALRDARAGQCRWVCGPIDGADTPFCGAPCEPGRSWCATHAAVVFERVAPKQKRPAYGEPNRLRQAMRIAGGAP